MVVLGISPDKPKTQAGFRQKQCLPFTLLADPEKKVAEAFGVAKLIGVQRATFLIGPDGLIQHVFEKVKPAGHAREVLKV